MNELTIKLTDEAAELLEKLAAQEHSSAEKIVGSIIQNFFVIGG